MSFNGGFIFCRLAFSCVGVFHYLLHAILIFSRPLSISRINRNHSNLCCSNDSVIKEGGGLAFASLLVIFLAHLIWKQVPVYKNVFTLWNDTVQKNPNAWMAHYNLGNILIAQQKHEEAIVYYQQTIRIKPDFSLAPYNLGNVLFAQKKNTGSHCSISICYPYQTRLCKYLQ